MKITATCDRDSSRPTAKNLDDENYGALMQPNSVRELAVSDLERAILLIATCLQVTEDYEQWEFCLRAAGQDSPLCRDLTSFKAPTLSRKIRSHALQLYALCPFTLNFRSVISELGYATATLHVRTEQAADRMLDPQPV